jgi:hypothetical protein
MKVLLKHTQTLLEAFRPQKRPFAFFPEGQRFEDFVLLEESFSWTVAGRERTFFLMKDGSMGFALWLKPLAHELLTEDVLTSKFKRLSRTLSMIPSTDISFQLHFDSEPDFGSHLKTREQVAGESEDSPGFADFLASKRDEFLTSLSSKEERHNRVFKRRILLCVRVDGKSPFLASGKEEAEASENFAQQIKALTGALQTLEDGLSSAGFSFSQGCPQSLVIFLRDTLHSYTTRNGLSALHNLPLREDASLSSQALYDTLEATPNAIGMGEDTWQMVSLQALPSSTFFGEMTDLLRLPFPHRIVVNFRPTEPPASLSLKRYTLSEAKDAQGVRQREDIEGLESRLQEDEKLFSFSWFLLARNEDLSLLRLQNGGAFGSVISDAQTLVSGVLGVPLCEEKFAAPLVFAHCLPFGNSRGIASMVGREKLCLSDTLVSLLPLFGGFLGTPSRMLQMTSRAGERIFLNPRDANGASHIAVLGGSGGGKSFLTANLICSFLSVHPQGRVFVVDKKTSYSVLAKLAGEERGATFLRPPREFANVFKGGVNEDTLSTLVSILKTAMTLVTPGTVITGLESTLLSTAIKETFEEKTRHRSTLFEGGELREDFDSVQTSASLPTLSEVVSNLEVAAEKLGTSTQSTVRLRELLAAFIQGGPYAKVFEGGGETDSSNPQITLCDLDGVSTDPVMRILAVQTFILEILRLVRPKDENTPLLPSLLIVEEVGVLAGESPELVEFVRDAWKTMRKFGVTCVGLTNTVADYADLPGAKEIWAVSPHKIILKQDASALSDMRTRIREGRNGLVKDLSYVDVLDGLEMKKGRFADAFWISDLASGTFSYAPTGFDYWCAASNPTELSTVVLLERKFAERGEKKPVFEALKTLATHAPFGLLDGQKEARLPTEEEIQKWMPSTNSDRRGGVR